MTKTILLAFCVALASGSVSQAFAADENGPKAAEAKSVATGLCQGNSECTEAKGDD